MFSNVLKSALTLAIHLFICSVLCVRFSCWNSVFDISPISTFQAKRILSFLLSNFMQSNDMWELMLLTSLMPRLVKLIEHFFVPKMQNEQSRAARLSHCWKLLQTCLPKTGIYYDMQYLTELQFPKTDIVFLSQYYAYPGVTTLSEYFVHPILAICMLFYCSTTQSQWLHFEMFSLELSKERR